MPDSLPAYVKIIIFLFLFTFLFSVALEKPIEDITIKSSLMRRSLLANFILIPILGMFLIWLFRLPLDISMGFLIVATAPGGLMALHFARIAKGNLIYAVGLVFLLSLLSVLITPILINLIYPGIGMTNVPTLQIVSRLLLLITPPLLLGQLIQNTLHIIVPKLQKVTSLLSIALFITLTILTSKFKTLDTQILGWNGLAALITFIMVAWIIGWLLGGTDIANRKVLAISTSMRNVAICLAIASSNTLTQEAELTIIGFSQLLVPMNLVFAIVMGRIKPTPSLP